jgi:hypothetical protein
MRTPKATTPVIDAPPAVVVDILPQDATPKEPRKVELRYNVTGEKRKELVSLLRDYFKIEPVYKGAPSFAFAVGNYLISKDGTITGDFNEGLVVALGAAGFKIG